MSDDFKEIIQRAKAENDQRVAEKRRVEDEARAKRASQVEAAVSVLNKAVLPLLKEAVRAIPELEPEIVGHVEEQYDVLAYHGERLPAIKLFCAAKPEGVGRYRRPSQPIFFTVDGQKIRAVEGGENSRYVGEHSSELVASGDPNVVVGKALDRALRSYYKQNGG